MPELSPAAQAVLDAAFEPWETVDTLGSIAAAALRAVADQVVPASPEMDDQLVMIRYRLCYIADELEAQ